MMWAKNATNPDDDSEEVARAQPHSRPGHRLHMSTWVVVGAAAVVLTLMIVPGRTTNHGAFTGAPLYQEHGWPLVFMDRTLTPTGTRNLSAVREFLTRQHLDAGIRWASFDGGCYTGEISLPYAGPPWVETQNWSFSGTLWVFKLALVVDLLTAFGIVVAVAAVCEWWRRRRWRYSIRCLLVATLAISATLSWSVGRHQLESRAADELRNNGFEVSLQCIAPVWLKMLIGENHLSTFAHVVCISALGTKPTPEDTDRCKRAVATMADNAKHLRWLRLLFLDSMPVTDADLRDIGAWTELEVVCLDGTQVTDAGLEYIHDLPRLRFLSLDHTLIAGTGLQYLRGLPQLQDLSLDDATILDAALCHMKGLPQLRDLSLNGTKVTDAGLLHLAGLMHLKTIRLNRTDITDRGLTQLKRLTHLEQLEVRETLVTDAGVDELRQVMSNCEVLAGQE